MGYRSDKRGRFDSGHIYVCRIFVNAGKKLLVYFAGYCRVDNPTTIPVELKHSPRHQPQESVQYSTLRSLVVFWRV